MEELIRNLPNLDLFESCDEFTVWLAKLVARMKWGDAGGVFEMPNFKFPYH